MLKTRTKILTTTLALCVALVLPGCRRSEQTPPGVIVRVGERHVTIEEFKNYLKRNTGTELAEVPPEAATPLLDQYLEEVLLSEYAAANDLEVATDKVAEAVREDAGATVVAKRDELRRKALLESLTASVGSPNEMEIAGFYNQNPDEFRLDEEVKVRQILIREKETAEKVVAELNAGGSFDALSNEYSTAPNADRGGEIGWVSRGQLPKIFEDVIFSLDPNTTSDLVEADANFHIFLVESHAPSRKMALAKVRDAIRIKLEADQVDSAIRTTLASAEVAFPVTVLPRRLPFEYRGGFSVSENE